MEEKTAIELSLFDQAWAWFDANHKQAVYGAIGVAVVALAVSYYIWNKGENEVVASNALSQTAVAMTMDRSTQGQSADAYLKVAAEHPGTEAAGRALLQAGAILFEQGKYPEAQAQFEKFTREQAKSPFVPQALLGVAASLEAQGPGKTADAAHSYEALARNYPSSVAASKAEFALANIYESQGKQQEALFIFEKIARAGLNTSIGSEAGIRAEELRAKMPAPASAQTSAMLPETATPPTTALEISTNKP